MRELVISHGRTGYVALYRFLKAEDAVWVLALRHQCWQVVESPSDATSGQPEVSDSRL